MRRANPALRNRIRTAIVNHFVRTGRGIYYEELANILGVPGNVANYELDFIGEEDIRNRNPPLDALVVLQNSAIPSADHFLHKEGLGLMATGKNNYYFGTIDELAAIHNVKVDPIWLDRVRKSLR